MPERRKDDEKIDELIGMVTEQKVLVEQVHKALFGNNGNPGMKAEWERHKGGLQAFKFVAGGSGIVATVLVVIKILEYIL